MTVADANDRFFVRRHFQNGSEQDASWETSAAELVFQLGPGHVYSVSAAEQGPINSRVKLESPRNREIPGA